MQVRQLKRGNSNTLDVMLAGAQDKRKSYVCVVWLSRSPSELSLRSLRAARDVVVQQRTPIRVLHRRTLMTRPKIVHRLNLEPINGHFATLHLETSAGTYVKEFVHGDLGRTVPNLGTLLGCTANILQLDVESVHEMASGEDAAATTGSQGARQGVRGAL